MPPPPAAFVVLAVPNSDGDEVPLDAPPPRLPNKLPLVFVVPWLDPNGELELKSPPAEAPEEAGVAKENPLDIFVVLVYQKMCATEERKC